MLIPYHFLPLIANAGEKNTFYGRKDQNTQKYAGEFAFSNP